MEQTKRESKLLENFMWSGIISFLFIFIFEMQWTKDKLGTFLILYQNVDYTICIVCFIMGGKKTLQLFGRIIKAFESVKKGEDDE
jgi:hypothetical protein